MGSRIFKSTWVGVYEANGSYRSSNDPILTGGPLGFHSFAGFNAAQIRNAIETSRETAKVIVKMRVGGAGRFRIGVHKQTRNTKASSLPAFRDTGIYIDSGIGSREVDITESFKQALTDGYQGLVIFAKAGENAGEATGYTNNSNHLSIEVQGLWNTKPGTPTITYPISGASIDGQVVLRGEPTTDKEQASSTLQYQWAVFDGD